jgi:2-(1,2-epoxy-1,2-dihydrophenyl)acetyl-CoA isomerase
VSDTVQYELRDGVATITLNRPDALNSLTVEAKVALRDALDEARSDSAARAVLLTGAGRGFCAGQDLREHAASLEAGHGLSDTVESHYNPIVLGLTRMPKPTVAAVNGVAAGAGAALAFACDLRVASERAKFSMAFTQVGLGPDSGASWTLQRLVGRGRAAELLLLAEPVDAARALEIGLVNRVVAGEELEAAARGLAERLAMGPTAAYHAVRQALDFASTSDLAGALQQEAALQNRLAATADHQNATFAFVRKERPVFQGS